MTWTALAILAMFKIANVDKLIVLYLDNCCAGSVGLGDHEGQGGGSGQSVRNLD